MTEQKCKNILLQSSVKDFWSSANPKLKKLSFSKLSLFQDHTEENTKMGVIWSYFRLEVICSTVSFQKKNLTLRGLQDYERHESHLMMS